MCWWYINTYASEYWQDFAFLKSFLKLITLYALFLFFTLIIINIIIFPSYLWDDYYYLGHMLIVNSFLMQPRSCSRAMKAVGVVEGTCEEIFELVMSMDGTRFE